MAGPPPAPLDLAALRLGSDSPTTPRTPLTPPLTPSSSTIDNSNPDLTTNSNNSALSTPPPSISTKLPPSPQFLRTAKHHLPRIDTLKILVDSESSSRHSSADRYDLNSPTAPAQPSQNNNGDHFLILEGTPRNATYHSLRQKLQHFQGIRGIQTRHLLSHGVIVLAFDDSRDAVAVFSEIASGADAGNIFPESNEKTIAYLCNVHKYQELYGASSTAEGMISEVTVIIELGLIDPQLQQTLDEELYRIMDNGGDVRSFQKMTNFDTEGAIVYLVDYFKASAAGHVLEAVNDHSISFAGITGKIRVQRSASFWRKQSSESRVSPVNEKTSLKNLYMVAPEFSSSFDSLPTLSRRHSTTSFQKQYNSSDAPSTAAPDPDVSISNARRLSHSISERNLRKKTHEDNQTRSPTKFILEIEDDADLESPQSLSESRSALSPLAQPFTLRQTRELAYPPSPGNTVPVYDASALTSYADDDSFYRHNTHPYALQGDPYAHYYRHTPYVGGGQEHHQILSLGSPISSSALSSPASASSSSSHTLGHEYQSEYTSVGSRYRSYDGSSLDAPNHSSNVNISHGLASPASSIRHRFRDSPSNPNHSIPPRNALDLNKIERGEDTRTTVMIKNIPNKMSDRDLLRYIGNVCPRAIDFLYLRMDFTNHCNVGYAFVNFMEVADLLQFAREKLGIRWNMFSSEKVLQMSYANYQGKEALVEKFKNSCIMNEREGWRPKIFYSSGPDKGLPEPFPAPTQVRRVERGQQSRGPLWGSNGPPGSPDDAERSPSLRSPRSGLWTRLRMPQTGDNDARRNTAAFYTSSPRHLAASRM